MIYQNPKRIIERYLKKIKSTERSQKYSKLQLVEKIIDENYSKLKRKEDSVKYERLENDYISEYLKKKLNRSSDRGRLKVSSSEHSICSRPTGLEKSVELCSDNRSLSPLGFTDNNLEKRNNSLPNIHNSLKHIRFTTKTKQLLVDSKGTAGLKSYSSAKNLNTKVKVRVISRYKSRAMHDYYHKIVKPNYLPALSRKKKIESSLKSYNTENKKTYKDFKIVKFL